VRARGGRPGQRGDDPGVVDQEARVRRHCGQLGAASARRPASSSRMNDDQIIVAALPAK
jgi:hypothetical protein